MTDQNKELRLDASLHGVDADLVDQTTDGMIMSPWLEEVALNCGCLRLFYGPRLISRLDLRLRITRDDLGEFRYDLEPVYKVHLPR